MNYLQVFLVHDGKQKNVFAIHFANYRVYKKKGDL
jgi:hypothetical protein